MNDPDPPIFYISSPTLPSYYPRHLTGPVRSRYEAIYSLHHQLRSLWEHQLHSHCDTWTLRAAHEFWWHHGPTTIDGRKFAWIPNQNWILDALDKTHAQLDDLERDAEERIRAIRYVTADFVRSGRVQRSERPRRELGWAKQEPRRQSVSVEVERMVAVQDPFASPTVHSPGLNPLEDPALSRDGGGRTGCYENPIVISDEFDGSVEHGKGGSSIDRCRFSDAPSKRISRRNSAPESLSIVKESEWTGRQRNENKPEAILLDISSAEIQLPSTTSSPSKKRIRDIDSETESVRSKKSPKMGQDSPSRWSTAATPSPRQGGWDAVDKEMLVLEDEVVSISIDCDVSTDGTI
ncbi:hypothetical protein BGW36DRAFT_456836 [Talaromyces proteolyticus]|uniref:Uncharacterized protein n=1 Tax=Talaromyces proteolyticus TaxID=1131652 RepID=A0AAD4Q660_9EURO|nr:uncharacterized protein BGW36DRAFT_456836 [Talaromyces proteolyticus]KAH8705356.1 hypothetical protein BGW36DRAFT_456836 [Talaromyces proteolyticus]